MAGSCYATRCERVQKRHLARSRVTRIPSRQAPFLIRHIVVVIRRFRPPINPLSFPRRENHSSRRIKGRENFAASSRESLETKGYGS